MLNTLLLLPQLKLGFADQPSPPEPAEFIISSAAWLPSICAQTALISNTNHLGKYGFQRHLFLGPRLQDVSQATFPKLDSLLLSLQLVEKVTADGNIQPTWQTRPQCFVF